MTNEEATEVSGSQKAEAYLNYMKMRRSGAVWDDWHPLKTQRIDLIPPGEPVDGDSLHEAAMRAEEELRGSRHFCSHYDLAKAPVFIRACPLNPRPGVLESSPAFSQDEFMLVGLRIIEKMLSLDDAPKPMYDHGYVDPHGSIIIQPFIKADASCVAAPGSYIVMGPDHDGVTAGGKGLKVAIPHTLEDDQTIGNLKTLGIDPAHIELEFVSRVNRAWYHGDTLDEVLPKAMHSSQGVRHDAHIVQLRGSTGHASLVPAPAGVTINGLVPQGIVEVKHVHLVADDGEEELARMEAALHDGMPEGTVVAHPNGTHLSHHAGQCRKYEVPYIASNVEVGSTWVECASGWVIDDPSFEPQPYDPYEYYVPFARGLYTGLYRYARQYGWLSNHFHQFVGGPLMDPESTAYLGGVYVGWVLNSSLAVAVGELRHAPGRKNNLLPSHMATIEAMYEGSWIEERDINERKHYYATIEKKPITIDSIQRALGFLTGAYESGWGGGGYGGAKYAESCVNSESLAFAVREFITGGFTKEALMRVIGECNVAEHNVHNNGYFFNKFMSKTSLDWGTNPLKVRMEPGDFFRVYYAARAAWEHYEDGPVEQADLTGLFDYVHGLTPNSLRKSPLFSRDDLPEELQAIQHRMSEYPIHWVHNGQYSEPESDQFVPCGLEHCHLCAQHKKAMVEQKYKDAGMYLGTPSSVVSNYDMAYPVVVEDAPAPPDYPLQWYSNMDLLRSTVKQHSASAEGEMDMDMGDVLQLIAEGYYISQVAVKDSTLQHLAIKAVSLAETYFKHLTGYDKGVVLEHFLALKENN